MTTHDRHAIEEAARRLAEAMNEGADQMVVRLERTRTGRWVLETHSSIPAPAKA